MFSQIFRPPKRKHISFDPLANLQSCRRKKKLDKHTFIKTAASLSGRGLRVCLVVLYSPSWDGQIETINGSRKIQQIFEQASHDFAEYAFVLCSIIVGPKHESVESHALTICCSNITQRNFEFFICYSYICKIYTIYIYI